MCWQARYIPEEDEVMANTESADKPKIESVLNDDGRTHFFCDTCNSALMYKISNGKIVIVPCPYCCKETNNAMRMRRGRI